MEHRVDPSLVLQGCEVACILQSFDTVARRHPVQPHQTPRLFRQLHKPRQMAHVPCNLDGCPFLLPEFALHHLEMISAAIDVTVVVAVFAAVLLVRQSFLEHNDHVERSIHQTVGLQGLRQFLLFRVIFTTQQV